MAISRVHTWSNGEVLTHTDLNAEFDNILNNALSLISPLTGELAAGGNDVTGLDELAFNNASANASAVGRIRRNSTRITWHNGTASKNLAYTDEVQGLTLLSAGTAAAAATLDFTSTVITTTYDRYLLYLTNVVPSTDASDLWMRFSQSGTFLSGVADYSHIRQQSTGSGSTESVDLSDAQIILANAVGNDTATGECGNFLIDLQNLANTASRSKTASYRSVWVTSGAALAVSTGGARAIANHNAYDGVRLMFSAGNISCEYALFGVRKTIAT
jgi:hypothetical protein